jgi:8-oxo-dGTP diphosphatase
VLCSVGDGNASPGRASPTSVRREYPPCPIPSAHAIVLRRERVLLVRRARPPSQGGWSVPGGVIELGETIGKAAEREVREECGVEIRAGTVIDVADNIVRDKSGRVQFHYVVIYVQARYVCGEICPASDAADVRWAGCEELETLDMHPAARQTIRRAYAMRDREVER